MTIEIGQKALITTDAWFFAPDPEYAAIAEARIRAVQPGLPMEADAGRQTGARGASA